MIININTGCVLLCFLSAIANASPLSLRISGLHLLQQPKDYKVLATITNTSNKKINVLNDPRGPLSKFPTDTFQIQDGNGKQPRFKGIKLKYVPVAERPEDYSSLAPGESVEVEHDLGEAYDFAGHRGPYNITGNDKFYSYDEKTHKIELISANSISHYAQIIQAERRQYPAPSRLGKRAPYIGCTTEQQETLQTAALKAQDYAREASSYANSVKNATVASRYTSWFGVYDDARHDLVKSQFSAISTRNLSSFTYDCSCSSPYTFAYVYPDDFGRIYLCGAFWRAPMTGTDSKAGTIIHETSHFPENEGGTIDYAYGQSACRTLAVADPSVAVINADSHEYFAENNPVLL